MALPLHALQLLAPYLRDANVLSLGYPDITVEPSKIEALFGYKPSHFTNEGGWHGKKFPLPQTEELFEKLGAKLTVVDFTAERGMEVIADLNYPHDLGQFDVVLDPGTLEHCFNIGQALMNAANAVKLGGVLLHLSPMTMLNHGFYNLCPTLFNDFYEQNGWEVDIALVPQPIGALHTTGRFSVQAEYLIRALATRRSAEPLHYCVQTKYRNKMFKRKEAA